MFFLEAILSRQIHRLAPTVVTVREVSLTGKTVVHALGDSITVGQGASPSSQAYIQLFRVNKGLTLTNFAVGARTIWNQVATFQNDTFTYTTVCVTAMLGLNDLRLNGDAPATLNKIKAGYRSIAVKCYRSTAIFPSAMTLTGGTFSNYNAGALGGTATLAQGRSTTDINATFSYVFTGTNIVVQLIGADGVLYNYGTCDILIDGVVVQSVVLNDWWDGKSDGVDDNGRGPTPFCFFNLTNTSHTVTIKNTNGGFVGLDFVAQFQSPGSDPAVIFLEVPYLTAAGYLTGAGNGSRTKSDNMSAVIRSVYTEFRVQGYNIGVVRTNQYYDPVNSVDGIHPSNIGHLQIDQGVEAVCI